MSIFASGVSGGVAVTSQTDGVTLSTAGDYAVLYVSNAAPPGGPDASVSITLSGDDAVGANLTFTKKYSSTGTATTLGGVLLNGNPIDNPYLFTAADTDLTATGIAGLYSITITLSSITSGEVLVQGLSSPANVSTTEVAMLAALTTIAAGNRAIILALQDMIGTSSYQPDYLNAGDDL